MSGRVRVIALTFNQRVVGSIPTALTNKMKNLRNDPKVSELAPLDLGQQSGQQLRILSLPSRAQPFELPLIAEGASRPSAASNAHGDRACLV
jgi:hypothetical protein